MSRAGSRVGSSPSRGALKRPAVPAHAESERALSSHGLLEWSWLPVRGGRRIHFERAARRSRRLWGAGLGSVCSGWLRDGLQQGPPGCRLRDGGRRACRKGRLSAALGSIEPVSRHLPCPNRTRTDLLLSQNVCSLTAGFARPSHDHSPSASAGRRDVTTSATRSRCSRSSVTNVLPKRRATAA